MSDPDISDEKLITSITPDVMKCLGSRGFFERLDNLFCPTETSRERQHCGGNYEISRSILTSLGFSEEDIEDVCAVLAAQGGCCDCEVLYNVAEPSRLRAEYWRAQVEGADPPNPHRNPEPGKENSK
jgi:hypothetical protein